ncbi:MAG TPA: glycosyltransferase family 2 protein [Aggregatilinea sp.]|uniref:glycosyltransferase family 2 protein n=1 Tax=Aggregatilinea sp. TaxID=2806333 RepID=UPI002C40279C|nr:glycosyltransferase family 2 protein [Aggregatilinea sp.]HML22658.1 glycosyltransferase family 2 protein [Aggregatilinea sp.]
MTFESVSVVVPCYNSEASLPLLLEQLLPVLEAEVDRAEVILVNDDSRDGTWNAITQLAGMYPNVRGVNLMRNYGQHNALLCGIRAARGEVVITMDDDLQHPPEEIRPLLSKLAEGYDVVYGTPQREQHGIWRDMASQMTKLALQSAMGTDIARSVSAFRVFRTQLRDAFADYSSPFVNIDVLLTWATKRFAAVPVRHDARTIGVSNYTFKKLLTHAVNMITGFSVLPLQLASYVGFGTMLFGVVILIYVLVRYVINGGSVPGFPFLASMIAIFSGVQLFVVGIFGEYLARMYQRTMNRPIYTVRDEVGGPVAQAVEAEQL